jgi:cytochrome d ubiquinol oxidase subunit I
VFFNPTRIPLDVHRFGGNFVWAAFFIGAVAAALALRSTTHEDRAFFDRIGGFLAGIGALFLILQPMAGFSYMRALRDASWDAFERMMRGERAWVFVTVTVLVSGLFILSSGYMFMRAEHSGLARTRLYYGYKRFALASMLLLAVVFALPYQASGGFFLSAMQPYKYIAMTGLMLFGIVNFAVYARAVEKKIRWGEGGRRPQLVLMALGVLALLTMLVMGYARENARNPWLIYNVIRIEDEANPEERFVPDPARRGAESPSRSPFRPGGS